jgi:hypothetical protein
MPKVPRVEPEVTLGTPNFRHSKLFIFIATFAAVTLQKYKLCWLHHAKTEFARIFFQV